MVKMLEDFYQIRKKVIGLATGLLLMGAILLLVVYSLSQKIHNLETNSQEYHLKTMYLAQDVRLTLHEIQLNLFDKEKQKNQSSESTENGYPLLGIAIKDNFTEVFQIEKLIDEIRNLQDIYLGEEYSNLVARLSDFRNDLQRISNEQWNINDYNESTLPQLDSTLHQLILLHQIKEMQLSDEIRSATVQSFLVFVVIATIIAIIGLFFSSSNLKRIKLIYVENAKSHLLLKINEAILSGILNTTTEGIISINKSGEIKSFNKAASNMFGCDGYEAKKKNIRDLISSPDTDQAGDYIDRVLARDQQVMDKNHSGIRGSRQDGSSFPIEIQATEMVVNQEIMFNLTIQDLTTQKQLEVETHKLHKALDESANEIYIFDVKDLRFSFVNKGALKNLGYSSTEIQSMTPVDLKPAFDERTFREKVQPLIDGEQTELIFETDHLRKNGSLYPVEIRLSIAYWEEQAFFVAVILDITKRKLEQENQLKLQEKLQHSQKLESLGVLAGGIAHDFNNLLTSILGHAELSKLDLPSGSPSIKRITGIETATMRAAELCRQMLAYSGKGQFAICKIDLNEMVRESAQLLEVSISKQIQLKYQLEDELPLINADRSQLLQVIMNLVINASEAIGETSGEIVIRTGQTICDRNYINQLMLNSDIKEGQYIFLEVSDTGCGMSEETRMKLFDPFYTTKFIGRGLGLAAVLGIVRGHHGAITIYSEFGMGSNIKILLPLSNDEIAEPDDTEQPEAGEWRGHGTVLLVDDEESVTAIATLLLENLGFTVISAVDGVEALEIYRTRMSDIKLVLLDLTMPRMGGEETLLELRKFNSDVKVILCSGYSEQQSLKNIADNDRIEFLNKPYRISELRAVIRRAMEHREKTNSSEKEQII